MPEIKKMVTFCWGSTVMSHIIEVAHDYFYHFLDQIAMSLHIPRVIAILLHNVIGVVKKKHFFGMPGINSVTYC